MILNHTILVIGGDKRLFYLAEKLEESFTNVITYGVAGGEGLTKSKIAESLKDAMAKADIIVTPIPFTRDKVTLFADAQVQIDIKDFLDNLYSGQILFGGDISSDIKSKAVDKGIICHDFMKMEQVVVDNALTTAEGAVAEAIVLSVHNIHSNNCLVLGYGRCGKAIAKALDALGADVIIAARSETALLEAAIQGYQTIPLKNFTERAKEAVFIFNTIPAMILEKPIIDTLDREAIIIDIASAPGGTDFKACESAAITAKLSLGIPGRFSPKTSAEILFRAILRKLVDE